MYMTPGWKRSRRLQWAALVIAACSAPTAYSAPDPDGAGQIFSEAQVICTRDRAGLWGRDLCGPILVVDPEDRSVVANEPDAGGVLKASGRQFAGKLPEDVLVSNTPIEWSGKRWTELIWPMTFEPMNRHVTLAHELFHRIQASLGLTRPEAGNAHLDTLQGRYLLQLEWRALAHALTAVDVAGRNEAIGDALMFRQERYRLFPAAAADEAALEMNEGVPEYTGVRLGLQSAQERIAYAVYDLSRFVETPSFVRSFAYATGPAYGLLLDSADAQWRTRQNAGARLDELLAKATSRVAVPQSRLQEREAVYDDGTLRSREQQRDSERRARLAAYRERLVAGPVLSVPLLHANFQFNPQTLVPLEGAGTIYPTMRVTDDWGALEVSEGGALATADKSAVRVSARNIDSTHLKGPGWRLTLAPGWTVQAGVRPTDLKLGHTE